MDPSSPITVSSEFFVDGSHGLPSKRSQVGMTFPPVGKERWITQPPPWCASSRAFRSTSLKFSQNPLGLAAVGGKRCSVAPGSLREIEDPREQRRPAAACREYRSLVRGRRNAVHRDPRES